MTAENELKPCPFCNGMNIEFVHAPETWMECDGCGANGPMGTDGKTKWNLAYCWKLLAERESRIKELEKDLVFAGNVLKVEHARWTQRHSPQACTVCPIISRLTPSDPSKGKDK